MKILFAILIGAVGLAGRDVPVPSSCTPGVNQKLGQLIDSGIRRNIDNVMACGVTTGPSRTQHGGPHGDHQILSLSVRFADDSTRQIEVVTNDSLDGRVRAPAKASVFAYGQAFFSHTGRFAAGVHDVHCSTHSGADNGWVVVNGKKYPSSCR
jgi:hypothetical protein